MRSVFLNKYKVHTKYDIKGSSVDRAATIKEKEKNLPTYKDNDLLNDNRNIQLGSEAKRLFMEKLTRDVSFLCDLKIMDYSLLIGIHEIKPQQVNSLNLNNNNNNDLLQNPNDYYSDQDNFSPGEDAEDTDDGQLNCKFIYFL